MRYLKNYIDYIAESVKNIDYIYNKYYTNLDREIFDKILSADPTTNIINSKMGIFSKWLLNLYTNKKLKLEDLYKATEYLTVFNIHKKSKNITSFSSLVELFKYIEPFLEREEFVFENDTERKLAGQFKEVYRDEKYRIIIPLTLKASQYFGRDTEWCTVNTNMFEKYTEYQDADVISIDNLYIIYTEDLNERLQFHFAQMQYMDVDDNPINYEEFFDNNPGIKNFFYKQDWFKYVGFVPNDYINEFLKENGYNEDDIDMAHSEYHDGFQLSIEEIFVVHSEKIKLKDIEEYFNDKPIKNFSIDEYGEDTENEYPYYLFKIVFYL